MNPPGASWPGVLALAALGMLAACVPPEPPGFSGISADEARRPEALHGAPQADSPTDPGLIRAPEVFNATGVATWDGNRTVSGVWVAHPAAVRSRSVRVVNSGTGAEVDAVLYRPERSDRGDIVTVSSETAEALGLAPGVPTPLSLIGLRPVGSTSAHQRRATETTAQSELASHMARMERNDLLQLVAAAMRGMGYATVFEPAEGDALPEIRAFPRPDQGLQLPAIRVLVRPAGMAPMTARELAARQAFLTNSGDLGVVVSLPGFEDGAIGGLDPAGARLEMVDLEGLLEIWLTYYEGLSEPDRALLPLQPVWFLAEGQSRSAAPAAQTARTASPTAEPPADQWRPAR